MLVFWKSETDKSNKMETILINFCVVEDNLKAEFL